MFGGLTDLLKNFSTFRKYGPLFMDIMDAPTLREKVAAAYAAAVAIAAMTPTPSDDAVLAYFKQGDRFEKAVDLVVAVLALLGFEDGVDIEDGPFRGAVVDHADIRAMVTQAVNSEKGKPIQTQAGEVGIGIPTLITVASLVIEAIQNAPMIVGFLKNLFRRDKAED
jgi:hypothetical protein